MHHRISGPAIEQAVGVPQGTVLDMRLLGRSAQLYGRMEVIAYEGQPGRNLFPAAEAPATGILSCAFHVASHDRFEQRAEQAGVQLNEHRDVDILPGRGRMLECRSPAGLKLQVFGPD